MVDFITNHWKDLIMIIIGFGGFYFVHEQIKVACKQIEAGADQSRREKSIDLIFEFNNLFASMPNNYIHLLFNLGDSDIEKIGEFQAISVSKNIIDKHAPFLLNNKSIKENSNGEFEIPSHIVANIRKELIKILNVLEAISVAYINGAVDKKIIEDAFGRFFIDKNYLDKIIKLLINIHGDWQNIKQFQNELEPKTKTRKYVEG